MTENQRRLVVALRQEGMGYGTIAGRIGVPVNTIKSFCRRQTAKPESGRTEARTHRCLCCGKPTTQEPGRREKKFCSDKCRTRWWNSHASLMEGNAVCAHCGKPFHGRTGRKYCCHTCYIAERFGGRHAS